MFHIIYQEVSYMKFHIVQIGEDINKICELYNIERDILEKLNLPICKAILEYRGIAKLLSTYIDKLPQTINAKTKRIHASFNQIGADTGRFSSSDPKSKLGHIVVTLYRKFRELRENGLPNYTTILNQA